MKYYDPNFETPEDIKTVKKYDVELELPEKIEEIEETGTIYDSSESPVIIVIDGTYVRNMNMDTIDITINFREE